MRCFLKLELPDPVSAALSDVVETDAAGMNLGLKLWHIFDSGAGVDLVRHIGFGGHPSEPSGDLATTSVLDQGERETHESSMAKVICSEAIWRIVDRSIQILGGLGITDDTIVARLFREVRPFRIYDGPSEGHRWSIARRILRAGGTAS